MNIEDRLVRYAGLVPCLNAFIDTRTPGSDRKENFTIIGPGVAENPSQHVHIRLPHGFNIGGARQPPGCLNSQHSHLTEEVFIVHSGTWAFRTGVNADAGEILLRPGDVISLPVDTFRGFENVGEDPGFLFAILGGDDPGRVLWAPQVFDLASQHGLILLENGSLVDTKRGESILDGQRPMPRTNAKQVAAHREIGSEALKGIVVRKADYSWSNSSALTTSAGVQEAPLLGPRSRREALAAGHLEWPHGFVLRALRLEPGAVVPPHRRNEEEVLLMHSGQLVVQVHGQDFKLGPGDTFSTPIRETRSFCNASNEPTIVHVARHGDQPAPPLFS